MYTRKVLFKIKKDSSYTSIPHASSSTTSVSHYTTDIFTTLHLRVQEVTGLVNVLDGLLGDTVALLLPRHGWVGEDTIGRALGHGTVAARLVVLVTIWQRDVERGGSVLEGLSSREVSGDALKDLIRSAQVRKLIVRGSRLSLVALDTDVQVGNVVSVKLTVNTNNLVVEVLLEVRLDVFGTERLKFSSGFLSLEAGSQGKGTLGHDGLRSVGTTLHHATENTVGTNVVGVLGVVGGRVVVGIGGAVAVRRSTSADRTNGRSSRVGNRVRRSGVRGRVAAGLANEAVDSVRSLERVLVGDNGKNSVVVALLDRTSKVLASLRLIITTLGKGPLTGAVELSNGASHLLVGTVAGLRVVVSESAGLLDINRGEVVTSSVLGEGLERGVLVLGLTLVPLSHGTDDVTVGDVGVGSDELVHGEQTVNVGVVKPEEGVESRDIKVVHVSATFATSSVVDGIVNGLEAVNTAAAQVGANTDGGSASSAPVSLAGEQSKDTVTERDAHGIEASVHLVVVAAGRVGNRATERLREVVPWASTHLRRKRVAEGVLVQRVGDGDSSLRLGNGDGLVAHLGRDSGATLSWVHSPVPVRHTESRRGVPPSLLLVGGESSDNLHDTLVPCLL